MSAHLLGIHEKRRVREAAEWEQWRATPFYTAGHAVPDVSSDEISEQETVTERIMRRAERLFADSQAVLAAHRRIQEDADFFDCWTTSAAFPIAAMVPPGPLPDGPQEWKHDGHTLLLGEGGKTIFGREMLLLRADHRAEAWLIEDRGTSLVSHSPMSPEAGKLVESLLGSDTLDPATRRPLRALDPALFGGTRFVEYDRRLAEVHRAFPA